MTQNRQNDAERIRTIILKRPDSERFFFFGLIAATPATSREVVMLDLCELWRLGVEYMPQLQMYEESDRMQHSKNQQGFWPVLNI